MPKPQVDPVPEQVTRMVEQAREYIFKALKFEVDGTDATLPVVDHYLSEVPRARPEIVDLVAATVGCYFGELVRTRFHGRWVMPDEDPAGWWLDLDVCQVSFFPVAVVQQAIAHGEDDRFDDRITVADQDRPALAEALGRMAEVPEDVYYTLANRFDTLEYIVEFLVGKRAQEKQQEPT